MIRCRFKTTAVDDPRPVEWPLKHPYWVTGYALDEEYATVVAYADDEAEIKRLWPEADDLDSTEVESYTFTDRFPKPEWLA